MIRVPSLQGDPLRGESDPLFVFASMSMANRVGVEVKYRDELEKPANQGFYVDSFERGVQHYRVTHLVANLGWVDFDLGCSTILLGQ